MTGDGMDSVNVETPLGYLLADLVIQWHNIIRELLFVIICCEKHSFLKSPLMSYNVIVIYIATALMWIYLAIIS